MSHKAKLNLWALHLLLMYPTMFSFPYGRNWPRFVFFSSGCEAKDSKLRTNLLFTRKEVSVLDVGGKKNREIFKGNPCSQRDWKPNPHMVPGMIRTGVPTGVEGEEMRYHYATLAIHYIITVYHLSQNQCFCLWISQFRKKTPALSLQVRTRMVFSRYFVR